MLISWELWRPSNGSLLSSLTVAIAGASPCCTSSGTADERLVATVPGTDTGLDTSTGLNKLPL